MTTNFSALDLVDTVLAFLAGAVTKAVSVHCDKLVLDLVPTRHPQQTDAARGLVNTFHGVLAFPLYVTGKLGAHVWLGQKFRNVRAKDQWVASIVRAVGADLLIASTAGVCAVAMGALNGFAEKTGGSGYDGANQVSFVQQPAQRLFKCFSIGFVPAFASTLFLDSFRLGKIWNEVIEWFEKDL